MNTLEQRRRGIHIALLRAFSTIGKRLFWSAGLSVVLLAVLVMAQEKVPSNQRQRPDRRTPPPTQTRISPPRIPAPGPETVQEMMKAPELDTRVEASDHSSNGITVSVEFGKLQWSTEGQRGRQTRKPFVRGTEAILDPGAPDLPVLVKLLQLPKSQARVNIVDVEEEPIDAGEIARVPQDVKVDYQGPTIIPDRPDINNRNAFWPEDWVSVTEVGMWRGHRLAALKIYPLRVNPVTGQGVWVKRITVRISFQGIRPNPIDPRPLSRTEQETLQSMLGEMGDVVFARERERTPLQTPEPMAGIDFIAGIDQYKVYVSREGLYRITYQDLVQAGVPVLSIEPRYLRLRNKGHDVPIYVSGETDGRFDSQDYIEFYGIPNRQTFFDQYPDMYTDPFSDINVYWLSWDNSGSPQGLRLIEESSPIIVEVDSLGGITRRHDPVNFMSTVHLERDRNFQRLSAAELNTMQDHWFMDEGINALESRGYLINLPYPDSSALDSSHIKIALTGLTFGSAPNYRYHHALVWLNSMYSPALDIRGNILSWYDQNPIVVDTRDIDGGGIPTRAVINGNNSITIQCMGDMPQGSNDAILSNWLDVTYPRLFKAYHNQLLFNAPASISAGNAPPEHLTPENYPIDTLYHFHIENFTSNDISIYKLGSSILSNYPIAWDDSLGYYIVEFQNYITEPVEYLALTQDQKLTPDSIRHCTSSGMLLNTPIGAGYLVITHPKFLSNANIQNLLSLRNSEYTTMLVSTEEIYDEFNDGIYSPYAIKNFLKYAYDNWPTPPEMVLLIGDLEYDMKGNIGNGGNWMPSIYVNGWQSGWYPSDYEYSLLSGDDLFPDIGIGRIPCRSQGELNNAITKIIHYESSGTHGPWRDTFLFISSTTALGSNFINATHEIMNFLPDWIMTQLLEQDPDRPYSGVSSDLQALFNQQENAQVVSIYNGHGAGGTWAGSLWLTGNVPSMNNAFNLPFITNFTCYICAFDSRETGGEELLGEQFLFNSSSQCSGAIAVYGSVSLGWFYTGIAYQKILMPIMAQIPGARLGDIVSISKGALGRNPGNTEITTLHQMVLLGDPAIKLALPMQKSQSRWAGDTFVDAGDTISLKIPAPFPMNSGDYRMFTHFYHHNYPYNSSLGAFPTLLDSPQVGFWEQHAIYQNVASGDTITVSVVLPNDAFNFMNYLGYSTAPHGSIRGYLYNGLAGTNARDAAVTSTFYRRTAYANTVTISNAATSPDTLYSNSSWKFVAKLFPGPGANIVSAVAEYSVKDASDSLIAQGSATMTDRSDILGPYMWWSVPTLGPFLNAPGGVATFRIRVQYNDSLEVHSNLISRRLSDHRPNLSHSPLAPRLGGSRQVVVMDTISNTGHAAVDSVHVRYIFEDNETGEQFTWNGTVHDIPGNGEIGFTIPVNLPPHFHSVQVFLDPDNLIVESSEFDNTYFTGLEVDHFQATRNRGTILPGVPGTATIPFDDGHFSIRIPSGSIIPDSAVLVIEKLNSIANLIGAQNSIIPVVNWDKGYRTIFGDSTVALRAAEPGGTANLPTVQMDTLTVPQLNPDQVGLYRLPLHSNYWVRFPMDSLIFHEGHSQDSTLHATAMGFPDALGTFTALRNINNCVLDCGPRIDISTEGQLFGEGSYVPSRPKFTAYIQDFDGIDLGAGKFWIAYGRPHSSAPDTLVPAEEIAWTDTMEVGGSIGLSFMPNLMEGDHWISVYATDNLGNVTYKRINFVVADRFEVQFVGNYPNPFQRSTLITYTLTDQATERVRIRIYTVSGRLIRTLYDPNPTPINYREVIWDGQDDDGNAVANGVYFARLRAVKDSQVIEETLKLAKIR
jgi:hypothetical protein